MRSMHPACAFTPVMMLCGSFLCNFVHFFIRTHADDNHQHSRFRALKLINDAYSSGAQLDFQQSSKVFSVLIAKQLSIAIFVRRQRILLYLLNCFQDKISLTAIKRLEVILGFRKVFKFPVHSISTLSKSLRSSSVTPRRQFISSSEISFDGS